VERPRVFVARNLPGTALDRLRVAAAVDVWEGSMPIPRDVLLERARGVEGLLSLLTERIDEELIAACPRLLAVSNYAVGYDNFDVDAATKAGVLLTNTPGVLTETTADLAFALLMAGARRVVEGDRFSRAGGWQTWGPELFLGTDVHGATLGVVGAGAIGSAVARRARGFEMRVLYTNRSRRPDLEASLGLEWRSLDGLLGEADFVSLHVPLSPETRRLIGARELALVKPSAVLVNTARGPVIDTDALYDALRAGRPGAAALDVTDPEPLPAVHPLYTLPNVIITPHIGSASVATRSRMADLAVDNMIAALEGRMPPNVLNPLALEWRYIKNRHRRDR
jgi:glyoxylate reductase